MTIPDYGPADIEAAMAKIKAALPNVMFSLTDYDFSLGARLGDKAVIVFQAYRPDIGQRGIISDVDATIEHLRSGAGIRLPPSSRP
jgi:hypothetical protein